VSHIDSLNVFIAKPATIERHAGRGRVDEEIAWPRPKDLTPECDARPDDMGLPREPRAKQRNEHEDRSQAKPKSAQYGHCKHTEN
jgi:hypothetical protein